MTMSGGKQREHAIQEGKRKLADVFGGREEERRLKQLQETFAKTVDEVVADGPLDPESRQKANEEVDALIDQIGSTLEGRSGWTCLLVGARIMGYSMAMMADLDPDKPEHRKMMDGIMARSSKFAAQEIAELMKEMVNTPGGVVEFLKDALSKLGPDTVKAIKDAIPDSFRKDEGNK
jgi:hypothetical protein